MGSHDRDMETSCAGLPRSTVGKQAYLFVKRFADIVLSAVVLIALFPVMVIVACLVRREDHGPVFYQHERLGLHGQKIGVLKFRSMRCGSDSLSELTPEQLEEYRKEFKISNDPRITKIGSVLRRTFLDELPQLINILRGEMSFVGPRPVMEEELNLHYREWERQKFLSMKPGLTGYWQICPRDSATYESGERQAAELYYIDHASPWLDIQIIWRTVLLVLPKHRQTHPITK